ncbi:MAG: S-layer family protein [Opitutaceae bacterium]|nr:S-layer family protein [Opitutaceae bacterium]
MAALPAYNSTNNTGSFSVTSGTATLVTNGVNGNGSASITTTDRSVLVWGGGNFNIGTGELFNFQTPAGGSVLNKVGYSTSGSDTATISGNITSGGKVFILANGGIVINGGANINTQGLILSTLAETSDFAFTTGGNLSFSGATQGGITIGSGASSVQVTSGSLGAWAGSVAVNNVTVNGDMLINQTNPSASLNIAGSGGPTVVGGNLSIITNNGSVTQSRVLTVGNLTSVSSGTGSITLGHQGLATLGLTAAGSGYTSAPVVTITGGGGSGATATATFNTTTGAISGLTITSAGSGYTSSPTVTIATQTGATVATASSVVGNDFVGNFSTTTTGSATVADRNAISLGASTNGGLTVNAGGNITTAAAVTSNGSVSLNAFAPGDINFASNSTVNGTLSASVAGIGNLITINTVGNLTVGTLTAAGVALNAVSVNSGGSGYTTAPTVIIGTNGGGTGAAATATVSGGVVTGINITNPGSGYTSAPTISINSNTGGSNPLSVGSLTAPIAASLNYTVGQEIFLSASQGGAGYDMNNLPTVTLTGGGGTGATVTPLWQNGVLVRLTITNAGTGYSSTPTVTLTGGGAPITAVNNVNFDLVASSLTGVGSLVAGGTGYTSAPIVTITGGGGSGATATASVNTTTGMLTGITILTTGTGYTTSPTVSLAGGGGVADVTASISGFALAGNGGNVTVSTTGNLTLSNNIQGGNVFVTAPTITSTGGTISTNGTVAYNATGGNLVIGSGNARKFVGVATGNITQIGAMTVIANSTDTHVFNATSTGNITLANSNNLGGLVQFLAGRDVSLSTNRNITLGTTNTSGNLTLNTTNSTSGSGTVTLGAFGGTATQAIMVGGNLNIVTNNAVIQDDNDSSPFVVGATNLNTNFFSGGGANIVLNAAANNVTGTVSGRFGQLNANTGTGTLTYSENTLINVGNVTTSGGTIRSMNSDIVINGNVVSSGGLVFNASSGGISQGASGLLTLASTSTFQSNNSSGTNLSNTANTFGGNVTLTNGGNNTIVSNSTTRIQGNATAGNTTLVVVNPAATAILGSTNNITNVTITSAGNAQIASGNYVRVNITANGTGATAIQQTGGFNVTNTLTLSTPGNVVIGGLTNATANITGNVVLANVTGDVAVHSVRNLTVSGTTRGNLTVSAGSGASTGGSNFANPWSLMIGNLTASSLNAFASNGSGFNNANEGASGAIVQLTGTSLHVENQLNAWTFGGDIVLANSGNSAGRVQLATGGATGVTGNMGGNITYREDSTVKVGNLAGNGTTTIGSLFGGIIEDPAATVSVVSNGTLALNAPNGSILLGNTTHTAGATTGNFSAVTLTAGGSALLTSTNNVALGAASANSLTVSSGNVITQTAPLNIFGLSSFNAVNGITLTDSANNFGPVVANITGTNKNVAITEANTLNLRSVMMPSGGNGTLSFTSLNGDIIDTGLGGVKLGGNATGTGSGVVTLSAVNGNITLDDPTSDILTTSGIVFNGNNVTFSILGNVATSIVLGSAGAGSSATGNLSVTSALGSIANAGSFTVGGNAFFQTTTGGITINQPGVNFGTLKFIGQIVNISESSDTVIMTGSQALGAAAIISAGNISVDNSTGGSVTFGSTVGMQATGNITLRSTQALNTITVTATGTKDLSALSLSTDLNNKTPVDLGAGAGPSTNPALAPKP